MISKDMQKILDLFWKLIVLITDAVLGTFFKLLGKEYTDIIRDSFLQFVKFGIVGVSNTFISYFIYLISLGLLRRISIMEECDYLIAQIISFILSVLWSFYWNNKMVFTLDEDQERNLLKALAKTYVSYSFTGLFLSTILLYFWVHILGISEFIAPILNLIISVPVNFIINKYWAFKVD